MLFADSGGLIVKIHNLVVRSRLPCKSINPDLSRTCTEVESYVTRKSASVKMPMPIREDLSEPSGKMCTRREASGRKSKVRFPSCVERS